MKRIYDIGRKILSKSDQKKMKSDASDYYVDTLSCNLHSTYNRSFKRPHEASG